MFFAIAALAVQGLQMNAAQERAAVDEEYRQQLLNISAEQERTNAEAEAAGRISEYNQVMAAQDIIFGTQGRKEEGSVTAIQGESERALERDVSLIRAIGGTRSKMVKAGAAGQASGFAKQQQAQSNQFVSNVISTVGGQVQ
jgi:Tfp pilus assembly protein PilV